MTSGEHFRVGDFVPTEEACGRYSPEDLVARIEGRLDGEQAARIDEHCSDCLICREFLEENALFDRLVRADAASPAEARLLRKASFPTPAPRPVRRSPRLRWSAGVAVALAAAAVGLAVFTTLRPPPARLPAPLEASIRAELESLPFLPPPDVRGSEPKDLWASAAAAWNSGNLGQALGFLEEVTAARPDDAGAWFYVGLCRLRLGQASAAVAPLRRATELEQPFPTGQTRWALAVALLRAGQLAESCDLLGSVEDGEGDAAERARRLRGSVCR